MRRVVVPFTRTLRRGAVGPDVRALKRALARTGHKGLKQGPNFGPATAKALHAFQKSRGLRQGAYTKATHRKLVRYYDAYGAWLMAKAKAQAKAKTKAGSGRERVVAAALLGYHNREAIHYTQSPSRWQGIAESRRPPRFPNYCDCSSFATWCYWVAGLPDPNGYGYRAGYTGTLAQHGKVVPLSAAKPGDLVLYGSGRPWHHVAIYIGGGRVVSHGSEGGPYLINIDYRSDRGEIRSYV